jgi:hypothetical protein
VNHRELKIEKFAAYVTEARASNTKIMIFSVTSFFMSG